MYQTTHSFAALQSIKSRGGQYLVVTKHSIGQHTEGDALSWHKTYEAAWVAADRAATPGFMEVVDINYLLAAAKNIS